MKRKLLIFTLFASIGNFYAQNVGIKTTTPLKTLHVVGSAIVQDLTPSANSDRIQRLQINALGDFQKEVQNSAVAEQMVFRFKIPALQLKNQITGDVSPRPITTLDRLNVFDAGSFIYNGVTYYLSTRTVNTNNNPSSSYAPGIFDLDKTMYVNSDVKQYNSTIAIDILVYSDAMRTIAALLPFKPSFTMFTAETTNSNKILNVSNATNWNTTPVASVQPNTDKFTIKISRLDHHFNFWEETDFYINALFIKQ